MFRSCGGSIRVSSAVEGGGSATEGGCGVCMRGSGDRICRVSAIDGGNFMASDAGSDGRTATSASTGGVSAGFFLRLDAEERDRKSVV